MTTKKLEQLIVVVGECDGGDDDSKEGIISTRAGDGEATPLMIDDQAALEPLRRIAQDVVNNKGQPARILRFAGREELALIEPQEPWAGPPTDWREHITMLPGHMREPVLNWFDKAEPKPEAMGTFLRSVLCGDLFAAYGAADDENGRAMRKWCMYLRNHAPPGSYGSIETLRGWYAAHHKEAP